MKITIQDDFNLEKIMISGQCFRAKRMEDGRYSFVVGDKILHIAAANPTVEIGGEFEISCSKDEWDQTWKPYFDLANNYTAVIEQEKGKHPFTDKAMDFGRGLRILRQEPWETLVSFIISQRKSIPAIAKSIEALATNFGTLLSVDGEERYAFPKPQQLCEASTEQLNACGLGYRTPYVQDAARRVVTGQLDLSQIEACNTAELLEALQSVHGVGIKVANCTALFSYGRMECAPVDVWIAKAIDEEFDGTNPFPMFGANAGIIQQYIFYYMKH